MIQSELLKKEFDFKIITSDFETVLPIWSTQLWPNRKSKIEALSAIDFDLQINMNIMSESPHFLIAKTGGEIIGVLSGHPTSAIHFRSRGLWVDPRYRKNGIGKELVETLATTAKKNRYQLMWSLPRVSSWSFYESSGFISITPTNQFEYGPHYLALRPL